jgi:hypothetical protein
MTIGDRALNWFDRYTGRWTNVWINVGLCIMFGTVAVFLPIGWTRDLWWFVAGTCAGYTFMWLISPRFNAARKREMEAEMSLIAAATLNRMTNEALAGVARVVNEAEGESDNKRRLQ